jgi:hypothetical protein
MVRACADNGAKTVMPDHLPRIGSRAQLILGQAG